MEHKVLVTTSGIGSRLGDLTSRTNKALVRVGKKPSISYIIEAYPKETKFVITLGYYGDHVQEFLTLAYPERSFEFVWVDKYEGPGTSLGYSMLQAKDHLQCPFIYHASDTIVTDAIPASDKNWIGVCKGEDSSQYASWKLTSDRSLLFNDKGALDYDYLHIGLVGIEEYDVFWKTLGDLYKANPDDTGLNDCAVIEAMLAADHTFSTHEFSVWYDIGNTTALHHVREVIYDAFENLDKIDESIFFFEDSVIKFFADAKKTQDRVTRAHNLKGIVPDVMNATNHFYQYKYVDGTIYSEAATAENIKDFFHWAEKNLWKPVSEVSDEKFKSVCLDFYKNKTEQRVQQFLEAHKMHDQGHRINGVQVPSIKELLDQVDFDWLSDGNQTMFHGDFILENIVKTKEGFCLIDWRQNFGGLLTAGDQYYDLAKFNHNLTVNHDIINRDLFKVSVSDSGEIHCEILRKQSLVECERTYHEQLQAAGHDLKKVQVLTGIIWLNMSPLHHHPFDQFLYYFGKLHLWKALNQLK